MPTDQNFTTGPPGWNAPGVTCSQVALSEGSFFNSMACLHPGVIFMHLTITNNNKLKKLNIINLFKERQDLVWRDYSERV